MENNLPTHQQCFEIIAEYRVPKHILDHCFAVGKIAMFLAKRLNEKGIAIDTDLLDKACILHDIVRVCDFKELQYDKFKQIISEQDLAKWGQIREKYRDTCHEIAAYESLKDKYPKLALTIKRHRYMAMLDEKEKPATWEEKLLFYSDMRAMHDKIVPLRKRLKDGHKRNTHLHGSEEQSKINTAKVDPLIYELEKEIFKIIKIDPNEISDNFIDSYPD